SNASAGLSNTRVRWPVSKSIFSTHGRGDCVFQRAPGVRVPETNTVLLSVPTTTACSPFALRFIASAPPLTESPPPPAPRPPRPPPPNPPPPPPGIVTPAPRLNFFDGSAVRIAKTPPLSATNIVLPSTLYATLVRRPLPS